MSATDNQAIPSESTPPQWNPDQVGDLFYLVNSHTGFRTLMKVIDMDSETSWASTLASLDDAFVAPPDLPEVSF